MDTLAAFKTIAPYLTHPLVLVGFVLFLFFSIHRTLLNAGIIQPLNPRTSGRVVTTLLRYGFLIALVAMVLGFSLQLYKEKGEHEKQSLTGELEKKRLDSLTKAAKEACELARKIDRNESMHDTAITACIAAVGAIAQVSGISQSKKEAALSGLAANDTKGAKQIYQELLDRKIAEGQSANREAAEAARHLGALAFLDNTKEALAAYQQAVKLDPDNLEGLNELGHLLRRIGQWTEAETTYQKVLDLASSRNEQGWLAAAYGNLGNVYKTRSSRGQSK